MARTGLLLSGLLSEETARRRAAVPVVPRVAVVRHKQRGVEGELVAGARDGDVGQSLLLIGPVG